MQYLVRNLERLQYETPVGACLPGAAVEGDLPVILIDGGVLC